MHSGEESLFVCLIYFFLFTVSVKKKSDLASAVRGVLPKNGVKLNGHTYSVSAIANGTSALEIFKICFFKPSFITYNVAY